MNHKCFKHPNFAHDVEKIEGLSEWVCVCVWVGGLKKESFGVLKCSLKTPKHIASTGESASAGQKQGMKQHFSQTWQVFTQSV